jgi:hypothetical protein
VCVLWGVKHASGNASSQPSVAFPRGGEARESQGSVWKCPSCPRLALMALCLSIPFLPGSWGCVSCKARVQNARVAL